MKVDIAVAGRFYAFRQAEELNKYNLLRRFYTIYLKRRFTAFGISENQVKTFYPLGAFMSGCSKLGIQMSDIFLSTAFDEWVARNIEPSEDKSWIFNGWNGFCEKSIIKAKKEGAVTVLERACPHIETQLNLMNEEMQMLSGKTEKTNRFHEKMVREYELADYIVVPSDYSAKSFIEKGFSPSKIKVVPLCYEQAINLNSSIERGEKFTVLFVGYNVYRKGLLYLLKAWNELNLPGARLIIRSSIPEEFKRYVTGNNITVMDQHISGKELADLYSQSSVFCLPSIDEGFGMVVLEAMASGLPVIITENVGAKDVITNGAEGFIVPIRDKEALKEKITFYYENREAAREMGMAAHKKAMEYSPLNYGKRIVALYKELCTK